MTLQLFSVEQAPRQLPIWPQLMEDLRQPRPSRVARALGVSVRTVRRYNETGHAPRAVCLAVFWLTSWGRSLIHAQAVNDAQLAVSLHRAQAERIEQLEALVKHLQQIGHFGAANEPGLHPPRPSRPHQLTR